MINSLIKKENYITEYDFIDNYIGKNINGAFEFYDQIFIEKKNKEKCFSELSALIFKIDESYLLFSGFTSVNTDKDYRYFIRIYNSNVVQEQETNKEYSCTSGYQFYNNRIVENDFFDEWENILTEFGFLFKKDDLKKENPKGIYLQINGYKTMYAKYVEHSKNDNLDGIEWFICERPKGYIIEPITPNSKTLHIE